jgi:glycosyltransferase involved in cell wall biosynthesis
MQLRFAVIHLGARLHYAVPAALEKAGTLQVLYTDAHAESAAAGFLRPFGTLPGASGIRRLLSRRIPASIPRSKIRSWVRPTFQIEWFTRRNPEARKKARVLSERRIGGHWLAQRAIADDFGGANALYVHPCVSTDAVREAKRRGMFVVLEAISHPFNKLVEKAEYERFGLPGPEPEAELRENIEFFKAEAELADLVLAASPYVREGLVELGLDPARIAVVPYGLDSAFFDATPEPVTGRVLYVGNIGYLKGVPHLAEAARRLKTQGFAGEIRAVGPHDGKLIHRPEFMGPNYVGQVPRSEVKHEFLGADLFAFPTLSDGFGVVLLEAMAAGLPVVCTRNCADVVRDGVNGFIIAPGDAEALASGIQRIVSDRGLRKTFSENARRAFAGYSLEAYSRRLIEAIGAAR